MSCYGHFGSRKQVCITCEYSASCQYYSCSPDPDSRSGCASLDAGYTKGWHHDAVQTEVRGLPGILIPLRDLAEFAKYLLGLDEASLGLLQTVIRGEAHTVSEIAVAAGLTRQGAHRRVLDVIARTPELVRVFLPLMPKLSKSRRRFLHKKLKQTEDHKEIAHE